MKTSIRSKILKLNLSGLLFCSILIGAFGILCANDFIKRDASEHLDLIAQKETERITARLEGIEQYVKTLTYVVLDGLDDMDELKDSSRQEAFTLSNLNFMRATIRNVSSAVAVYLRYNPAMTPPTSGVFLAKTSKKGGIQKQVPTDFSKYEPDDIEHVGWYYIPARSGRPIWMEPYENKNIDIYMISYVVPLFKFGHEVGVVGVDIDFDYLTKEISNIKLLQTGFAYLEREDGRVAYHPSLAAGERVMESEDMALVRKALPNGMRLVLQVPKSEINFARDKLIVQVAGFSALIILIFTLIAVRTARSITRPLYALTKAANQMTDGNLDVSFEAGSNDEIGILSKSLSAARDHMREYLGYLKGVAYRDALTGVRNKGAYDNFIADLQQKVNSHTVTEYAIAVFDVNFLKKINDSYGHDHGNTLLVNACSMICQVFDHSPVFRIGGDEFVAILQYDDYRNRGNLMDLLDRRMEESAKAATAPWERVSVAKGLASFNTYTNESVAEVFRRADDDMYRNKKEMKASREG